MALCNCSTVV